jgi:hypothetical protein
LKFRTEIGRVIFQDKLYHPIENKFLLNILASPVEVATDCSIKLRLGVCLYFKPHVSYIDLCKSMVHGIPLTVGSYTDSQEIRCFNGTRRFISMFAKACHWTESIVIESNPHIPIAFLQDPFLAYFPKKESGAYEITSLAVRLSVCPPLITFEPIGRFYEIQKGGHTLKMTSTPYFLIPYL